MISTKIIKHKILENEVAKNDLTEHVEASNNEDYLVKFHYYSYTKDLSIFDKSLDVALSNMSVNCFLEKSINEKLFCQKHKLPIDMNQFNFESFIFKIEDLLRKKMMFDCNHEIDKVISFYKNPKFVNKLLDYFFIHKIFLIHESINSLSKFKLNAERFKVDSCFSQIISNYSEYLSLNYLETLFSLVHTFESESIFSPLLKAFFDDDKQKYLFLKRIGFRDDIHFSNIIKQISFGKLRTEITYYNKYKSDFSKYKDLTLAEVVDLENFLSGQPTVT